MRKACLSIAAILALALGAAATNESPKVPRALIVSPHPMMQQDVGVAVSTLQSHRYESHTYLEPSLSYDPAVRLDSVLAALDDQDGWGWIQWSTHCPTEPSFGSVVTLECWPHDEIGDQLWNERYLEYSILVGPYYQISIISGRFVHPSLGTFNWIGVTPEDLDVVFDNKNTVVYAACCNSSDAAGDWGVREELGFSGDVTGITASAVANALYGALDGQNGIANRDVGGAASIASLVSDQFRHMHGDGETELSPVVLSVSPPPGSTISAETEVRIEFSGKIDEGVYDARMAFASEDGLYAERERWDGDDALTCRVTPYKQKSVGCRVRAEYVRAADNDSARLDGDGVGPNGDDYQFTYIADKGDTNYACGYEGAHAFRDADESVIVAFVTDPEEGTESFTVKGKSGSPLAMVPAKGGMFPHAYEVNVGPVEETEFLVLERDRDPATADTRIGPFRLGGGPPYLDEMRALNGKVASWEAVEATALHASLSHGEKTRTRSASDLVFLSSRSDFLDACHPVGEWWSQVHGWSSQYILTASPDPVEARIAFSEVLEAAITEGYRRRPLAVIVGEANQGYEPEKNIVGTVYFEDSTGNCFWGSDTGCASDASIVDFDGDGLPDMPWTRIVACTPEEIENVVVSALDYYENGNPHQRALFFYGDRYFCVPVEEPEATLDTVFAWYAGEGFTRWYLRDSSYDCADYLTRATHAAATVNMGISEIVGMAPVSNRSRLPGDFFQKSFSPVFDIEWLYQPQRIALLMPGCGTLDTDRSNPVFYPSIVKTFFVADPATHTTAVCAFGDMRGGWGQLHQGFAKEFFRWRFRKDVATIQEANFQAVRTMGLSEPGAIPYLRMSGAVGFPVTLGGMAVTGVDDSVPRSTDLILLSAPNPFNATTSIRFQLGGLARVTLSIYGIDGRRVRVLADREIREPGSYAVSWDGREESGRPAASGVYFVRLDTGRETRTRKVTLLR